MTTTFTPRADDARYCTTCNAHRNIHSGTTRLCPRAYRPSMTEARTQLSKAVRTGDTQAIFVARGHLQALGGRICPRCDGPQPDRPALSRTDDTTQVCDHCGTAEAMEVVNGALTPQALWPVRLARKEAP